MKTQTIAGHKVTLEAGNWYIATRPMADWGRKSYPVTITQDLKTPVVTIPSLTYDEANQFLAEFNNGQMSFDGRVW